MEASFWHQKWARGEIGFHQKDINPFLLKYLEILNLPKGSRIFLPLCGKTLDFSFLLANCYQVVGAELSELAVKELFKELCLNPEITLIGDLIRYSAQDIDVFVGDIFDVSAEYLGHISAIYDRAALVALPVEIRAQYTSHLMNITKSAPQLLITFEYDQKLMDGPPFSLTESEIKHHYGSKYQLKVLESNFVLGGLKGKINSTETAWLLQKNQQFDLINKLNVKE